MRKCEFEIIITWVVSGFKVKIASCKFPRKESMIRAPETITTPITLKFGDVCASAKVKRIKPTTKRTADTYSCGGYFLLNPGIKAPIIITGKTYNTKFQLTNTEKTRHSFIVMDINQIDDFNIRFDWIITTMIIY